MCLTFCICQPFGVPQRTALPQVWYLFLFLSALASLTSHSQTYKAAAHSDPAPLGSDSISPTLTPPLQSRRLLLPNPAASDVTAPPRPALRSGPALLTIGVFQRLLLLRGLRDDLDEVAVEGAQLPAPS